MELILLSLISFCSYGLVLFFLPMAIHGDLISQVHYVIVFLVFLILLLYSILEITKGASIKNTLNYELFLIFGLMNAPLFNIIMAFRVVYLMIHSDVNNEYSDIEQNSEDISTKLKENEVVNIKNIGNMSTRSYSGSAKVDTINYFTDNMETK